MHDAETDTRVFIANKKLFRIENKIIGHSISVHDSKVNA